MKRSVPFILLIVWITSCGPAAAPDEKQADSKTVATDSVAPLPTATVPEFNDSITLPADFANIGEARGDLTKDGVQERVIVVETIPEEETEGYEPERFVRIYKKEEQGWNVWQQIAGGVLGKFDGGMLGDPFQSVAIERGCIVLRHFGGSRTRWDYTHRYRFQNKVWELIGATVKYGAPCDSWQLFDYNLSNGQIEGEETTEDCDTDKKTSKSYRFSHQLTQRPHMGEYVPGTIEVTIPDTGTTFYF